MLEIVVTIARIGIIVGISIMNLGCIYAMLKYKEWRSVQNSKKVVTIGLAIVFVSALVFL